MPIIEVDKAGKVFPLRRASAKLLSNRGLKNLWSRVPKETFHALEDISFTLEAGEALGIIGANGSGKSTLLKILAGVTVPTTGEVRVYGRVASLLELGAGFHPLLTGRENVYLNAGILGMKHAEVDRVFDDIVEFSGVGAFIDNPIETYSSGMYVRIGFAVAVHTNPDLFLVDEVLSVGDEEFQRKCRVRIGELREQGKTLVFVSHDLNIVNTLCDRVILLSKGRMVQRGTPRETIDFYLRQIGRERSIHTMTAGAVEVITSHGRVSVFHEGHEISAPAGFTVGLRGMEQWHPSAAGDWEIVERGAAHCTARGRLPRLPLTHVWKFSIEDGGLVWSLALECERDVPLDLFDLTLLFPQAFAHWFYGEVSGHFPEILPGDLSWTVLFPPDLNCAEAGALPHEGAALTPVHVRIETRKPYLCLEWHNSDYIAGSRALKVSARLPESDAPLRAGHYELLTLRINLGLSADEVSARANALKKERTLVSGPISATLEHGAIRIAHENRELTAFVHLYTSMLMGGLWSDSLNMQWQRPRRIGERIEAIGESRRFPYRQHWELEPVENGVALRVWLEVTEAIDVQEYHASICILPEYERWQSPHEAGVFPPFDPRQQDWRHANRNYAPGTWIEALSSSLPSVTLKVTAEEIPFRMTAINTGFHQNARVLQALRIPEGGVMRFEPGRYLYFAGEVLVHDVAPFCKGS